MERLRDEARLDKHYCMSLAQNTLSTYVPPKNIRWKKMLGSRQSMCILLQGLYSTGLLKLMPVLLEGRNQTCSSTSALPVFLYAHFKSSSEGNSCTPHPPESILTSTCTCTCSSPLCVFWQTREQRRPMEAAWHHQWLLPHHTLPRDRDWTAQKLPGTNT